MLKKYLIFILISFVLNSPTFSAGSGGSGGDGESLKIDNFKKAKNLIKKAKKYEKKGKSKKAKKKFLKAIEYLLISNKVKPNQPDTLNYLGFASRKVGNFEVAEKYYLEGLAIDPKHNGINEYLGELYVNTNRIDKAKERLKVLETCNCEEFDQLQTAIKMGVSKY